MMPQVVNTMDAKTSLSKLVQALERSEAGEFIIARNGAPAARLMPLAKALSYRSKRNGVARGRFKVPHSSSESGNAEVLKLFEGT